MKINFHKYPAVDFLVRLLLTIIIISLCCISHGMPSKGRQVVIILRVWFLFSWSVFSGW
jgi:hypothetical protein